MKTYEEVKAVVEAIHAADVSTYWYISKDTGEVTAAINCNDFFFWACADMEPIEQADIPLLQQARADLDALDKAAGKPSGLAAYSDLLYCAKKRQMRPQGAYYKALPQETWPLFNACGPHRPEDFLNPDATPENQTP